MGKWTLFSNHGHVLVCLVNDPESRLRDVAVQVGITERAVQKIVRDLQDVGMLNVTKDGRRNRYRIDKSRPLRHKLESHCTVADLIRFVDQSPEVKSQEAAVDVPADEPPSVNEVEPDEPVAPVAEPAAEPTFEREPVPPPPAHEQETEEKDKGDNREQADVESVSLVEKQQGSLF